MEIPVKIQAECEHRILLALKIALASDIHLEFSEWSPPQTDADILVLAGDIGVGFQGIEAAKEWAKAYEFGCAYIVGNHELYKQRFPLHIDLLRKAAYKSKVTVLENEALIVRDVRLLGCTLWSDFKLYGAAHEATSRLYARNNINDYVMIKRSTSDTLLEPYDTQLVHRESLLWLRTQLRTSFDGQTVVVTHHAPSERFIHPRFRQRQDKLSPAFASNLEYLMGEAIHTWIAGHTHYNIRDEILGTQLISNCRGYPNEEHSAVGDGFVDGFNSELVITIST